MILKELWLKLNDYHVPVVTTFKERFCNVSFESHLHFLASQEQVFGYTAIKGNRIVGFILATANGDVAEIDSIFVEEEFRRRGIGTALMNSALKELVGSYKEIVMKVAEGNEQPFHSENHFKKRFTLFQYDYSD